MVRCELLFVSNLLDFISPEKVLMIRVVLHLFSLSIRNFLTKKRAVFDLMEGLESVYMQAIYGMTQESKIMEHQGSGFLFREEMRLWCKNSVLFLTNSLKRILAAVSCLIFESLII